MQWNYCLTCEYFSCRFLHSYLLWPSIHHSILNGRSNRLHIGYMIDRSSFYQSFFNLFCYAYKVYVLGTVASINLWIVILLGWMCKVQHFEIHLRYIFTECKNKLLNIKCISKSASMLKLLNQGQFATTIFFFCNFAIISYFFNQRIQFMFIWFQNLIHQR